MSSFLNEYPKEYLLDKAGTNCYDVELKNYYLNTTDTRSCTNLITSLTVIHIGLAFSYAHCQFPNQIYGLFEEVFYNPHVLFYVYTVSIIHLFTSGFTKYNIFYVMM